MYIPLEPLCIHIVDVSLWWCQLEPLCIHIVDVSLWWCQAHG